MDNIYTNKALKVKRNKIGVNTYERELQVLEGKGFINISSNDINCWGVHTFNKFINGI